jgi:predicted dehydrogenase
MTSIDRRRFLTGSVAAASTAGTGMHQAAASDRIIVGLMGCGGRGTGLINMIAHRPDIDIRYLCDVDQRQFGRVAAEVSDITGTVPQRITDFRRMLDDAEVDVVINATPNHWHGPGTVMACQAGKHVYVEKVASHNIWEGRKMVEAARKYNRVVQVGIQCRSADYVRHAIELVQSGKLGTIHSVWVNQMMKNGPMNQQASGKPVPDGLDWDMYCGPAPLKPFPRSLKGLWLTSREFSTGIIYQDAVHQMDLARWLIGKKQPDSVMLTGGNCVRKDGNDFPDTQNVAYQYGDIVLTVNGSTNCPYMQVDWKDPTWDADSDMFPNWMLNNTRVKVFGTEGCMLISRHGGGYLAYGRDGGILASEHGREPTVRHLDNFFECIRNGERPNGDIEEGHISATMCHLGNISYFLGNRKVRFDSATETFPGDPEANKLLKRTYREPWTIPDEV